MITTQVSGPRVMACPNKITLPRHYLGRFANPCRCSELEQVQRSGIEAQAFDVFDLHLRKRYEHALEHAKIFTSDDLLDYGYTGLRSVHSLDVTGIAAIVYKSAQRGIFFDDLMDVDPGLGVRHTLQSRWEVMDT